MRRRQTFATVNLSAMMMILAIYVAVSVIFSVGFVAGAWWASRARFDDRSLVEVERDDWSQDLVGAVGLGRRPSMAFANRSFP